MRAPAELLAGYQDAVHRSTVDYLATLEDDDYDRVVDERWDPPVTLARAAAQRPGRHHAARRPGGVRPRAGRPPRLQTLHGRSSLSRPGYLPTQTVLMLHELADAVRGELAAVAGGLDAAERQRRERRDHPVDEGLAGLEVADEDLLLLGVVGPGVRAEPEAGGVGDA